MSSRPLWHISGWMGDYGFYLFRVPDTGVFLRSFAEKDVWLSVIFVVEAGIRRRVVGKKGKKG